jgi:hypothetical protein
MMRCLRSIFSTLLVFGVLTLVFRIGVANAQMSEGERKAAARAAYTEGVDFQDKGKPAEALAKFEQAQKLFDAPTHLLHIGECLALTGKLVEASETYETLARKTLPAGSPDAFVQAQQRGQAELTELRQRIPTLRVTVKPDPSTLQNLQINLNDKQLPNEVIGIARPVNPGTYRLTARANGYATANIVTVDLPESQQKNVDLVLTQGATPIVVGPPPTGTGGTGNNTANPPPPYDNSVKPKPPQTGPSTTGLLLGARGGVFVPNGDVQKNEPFQNYASAGGGGGVDVIGRVAKLFLIGGTLELATLGGPNADAIAQGSSAQIKTSTIYYGILAGIMPNVDKVTFIADIGLGYRTLSQDRSLTINFPTQRSIKTEESYGGVELSLNAGLSIPVGPIRIVPKAGFAFGSFSNRECKAGLQDLAGACNNVRNPPVQTSGHTIFNVQLALYYHVDLAKKPTPPPAAATTQ